MVQPKVSTQSDQKRVFNFQEVALGYSKRIAQEESRRCPQCSDPVCQQACPIGVPVRSFIRQLREGNVTEAYQLIREANPLPSICGRICSAPCEAACVLKEEDEPIGIRALERYASDFGRLKNARRNSNVCSGKKIAIIGSGPAGLSAAADLARKGFQVTVFEAMDCPGGVLRYGIPEFRIPKDVLDLDIQELELMGVQIRTNFYIGQTASLKDLKNEGYKAIILAMGAGIPKLLSLPGSHLGGVYFGEEFLIRTRQTKGQFSKSMAGQNVIVIGSGNTALDCARVAKRLGAKAKLAFRRTEEDIRVRNDERELAKEEQISFESLTKPVEILANQDNFVDALKCVRMDFADTENTGAWELIPVEGSEFILSCDVVVIAIGHRPNAYLAQTLPDLKLNDDGSIAVHPQTHETSIDGVFACGNVVTNAGPVVEAIAAGKRCAQSIESYLR